MKIKGLSDHWAKKVDDHETAYFVLTELEKYVFDGWNEHTVLTRMIYYEKVILPRMNHRPLKEFTLEDIDMIIDEISKAHTIQSEKTATPGYNVSPAISRIIIPCIAKLFRAAEQGGICADIFRESGRIHK